MLYRAARERYHPDTLLTEGIYDANDARLSLIRLHKESTHLIMLLHSNNQTPAPHGPLLFRRKPEMHYGKTSKRHGYLLGSGGLFCFTH